MTHFIRLILALLLTPACVRAADGDKAATAQTALYECDFKATRDGRIPDGWRDLIDRRPSRNWSRQPPRRSLPHKNQC